MALEPMDVFAQVEADPEYDSMRLRFWISAAFIAPVLLLSMFGEAFGLTLPRRPNGIEFSLAHRSSSGAGPFSCVLASLVNRSPNMFTLIGLGTGAAYSDSVAATYFRGFPRSMRGADGSRTRYSSGCCDHHAGSPWAVLELRARQRTSASDSRVVTSRRSKRTCSIRTGEKDVALKIVNVEIASEFAPANEFPSTA